MKDLDSLTLTSLSLEEAANRQKALGVTLVEAHGIYWVQVKRGFFQPVHLLQRVPRNSIAAPARFCWGYRAALSDADLDHANGSIAVHLMADLEHFSMSSINGKRRRAVRQCLKQVEFREIDDPELIRDRAYELHCSALQRTQHTRPDAEEDFLKRWLARLNPGDNSRLVIGGLVEGELAGIANIHAVEGYAYVENIWIHSDHVRTNMGSGINYVIMELCRRSPEIHTIVHGQHARENERLNWFKRDIGLEVVKVPAYVSVHPIASYALRKLYPHKHYRLTGSE